jgi:hypothetical protein
MSEKRMYAAILPIFLSWWEESFRRLAPEEYLFIQRLLIKLPAPLSPEDLDAHILPLLATLPEEWQAGKQWLAAFGAFTTVAGEADTSGSRDEEVQSQDSTTDSKEPHKPKPEDPSSITGKEPDSPFPQGEETPHYPDPAQETEFELEPLPEASPADKLVIRQTPGLESDRFWNLPLPEAQAIQFDRHLTQLATHLRRPRSLPSLNLNVPGTIKESLKQNGGFSPQYKPRFSTASYLILIDRVAEENNHRSLLFEALFQRLKAFDLDIERWYYVRSAENCFHPERKQSASLSKLANQYPESGLIILGDGWGFLHPTQLRWANYAAIFDLWQHRVLATPIDRSRWTKRERLLEQRFTLLSASPTGLVAVGKSLDPSIPPISNQHRARINQGVLPSIHQTQSPILPLAITRHRHLVDWLGALSLFPSLRWNLTLFLGYLVGQIHQTYLLTYENLQLISRLPWFFGGQIPEKVRDQLVKNLSDAFRVQLNQAIDQHLKSVSLASELSPVELDLLNVHLALSGLKSSQLEAYQAKKIKAGLDSGLLTLVKTDEVHAYEYELPERYRQFATGEDRSGRKIGQDDFANTEIKDPEYIWSITQQENTAQAYDEYLSLFPNGPHLEEANRELERLMGGAPRLYDLETTISQLQQALSLELKIITDIESFLAEKYPTSYLEVITPVQEMGSSRYKQTAFFNSEGQLIGLNLFDCGLDDEQLRFLQVWELPHLLALNLSKNRLRTFRLSQGLSSLTYAVFNDNEDLQSLVLQEGLGQLTHLEVSRTSLTRLLLPESYSRIQYLNISQNHRLSELRLSGPMPDLKVALFRGNALQHFSLPIGYENLVHLYLNDNQLTKLHLPGPYPALITLQLRNNRLSYFSETLLEQMPQLEGLFLGRNSLPEELTFRLDEAPDQNHLEWVRDYFSQRKVGALRPNNECKVLLIGNSKAGKTAILNRIVNDTFNPDRESTHGISLFRKELGPWILNFWDFGGQDIYHATHRLFMQTNAVYLLAWSQETEQPYTDHQIQQSDGTLIVRRYQNYGLRYWLEYAKQLGQGGPMHVVQTKVGKDSVTDLSELAKAYKGDFVPEITFHAVESSEPDPFINGYQELLTAIENSAQSIKKGDAAIAQPLFDIREHLRLRQAEGLQVMSYEDYEAKAIELGVQKPREMLESWLHKSGVVYYRSGMFNNQIILDQGWAIKAIYTLFDRSRGIPYQIEKQHGAFNGAFVQDIWRADGYPDQDIHELFINFMKSSDLCFEIDAGQSNPDFRERIFLAPQLLQRERPMFIDDFWEGREILFYRYTDDFIQEGVIHSFITQTAYLADLREIWKNGIQIKEGGQFAMLEASRHADTIGKEINVRLTANAYSLLAKIRNLLLALQDGEGQEFLSRDGEHFEPLQKSEKEGLLGQKPYPNHEIEIPIESVETAGFEKDQLATGTPERIEELQKVLQELEKVNESLTDRKEVTYNRPTDAKPILFLAVNPQNRTQATSNEEYRQVRAAFGEGEKSKEHYYFIFSPLVVDMNSLSKVLNEEPKIIHFSGHSSDADGIYIQDDQGKKRLLRERFLNRIFARMQGITELVILNFDYSANQAQVVSEFGIHVIGINHSISELVSTDFSKGFYSALGQGKTFRECFEDSLFLVKSKYPEEAEKFEVWYLGEQQTDW